VGLAANTHLSIAWYLGTLLNPKRGVPVLLYQRTASATDLVWDGNAPQRPEGAPEWTFERSVQAEGRDLALVVSITRGSPLPAKSPFRTAAMPAGSRMRSPPASRRT
jgi:hypothetical protein